MSLLMKALEKAARDRDSSPHQPEPAAHSTALSLQPIVSSVPSAPPAPTAPSAPSNNARPAASTLRHTPASGATADAAIAWISTHPVPFTATLAGLFALGYGIYFYLQAAHPSVFLRTPPPQPVVAAPPATAVPPAPSAVSADTPLIPAQSVFSNAPGALSPSPPEPVPVVASSGSVPSQAARAVPAGHSAAPAAATAPSSKIVVSRGDSAVPRVNPVVSEAYSALEAARFDEAQRLYQLALRSEPGNIDALLGLAAIAQHENRTQDASSHYLKILDIDPRHGLAQTGLIALLGRADPRAAETRLKQLAAREPSPPLYFTLGNLYADQGQWPQAQQAYFQAHHLEPANPDYAYNLAVALEHLGQQKLALGFYRRALQLATGTGRSHFNSAQAQARITQLAARLE